MKKLFISQPMQGKSDEEILIERKALIARAQEKIGEEVEALDTFFTDFDGNALAFLGKSISALSEADVAIFGAGWKDARGCRIEHICCVEYGTDRIDDLA